MFRVSTLATARLDPFLQVSPESAEFKTTRKLTGVLAFLNRVPTVSRPIPSLGRQECSRKLALPAG